MVALEFLARVLWAPVREGRRGATCAAPLRRTWTIWSRKPSESATVPIASVMTPTRTRRSAVRWPGTIYGESGIAKKWLKKLVLQQEQPTLVHHFDRICRSFSAPAGGVAFPARISFAETGLP